MDHLVLIASLRDVVEERLRTLLAGVGSVALIEFPNHANVGDSAIYLGQLACLEAVGAPRPCYICDFCSYDRAELASRLAGGSILLSGGGTFGDIWDLHHRRREEIIAAFPSNPIVQLPQTIHFQHRDALARTRAVVNTHPDFTLLVRDRRSLDIAREEFAVPTYLCPDMAFCLGPLARPAPPTEPVVWLARTDQEAMGHPSDSFPIPSKDWLDETVTLRAAYTQALIRLVDHLPLAHAFRDRLSASYEPLARQRLLRGCRLLSSGSAVVTDRLHGHILSLLLGIPHVLLDNSSGKVRAFYETWTTECDLVRWGESMAEALAVATATAHSAMRRSGRGQIT